MALKEYSEKETRILDTAADFFSRQPFHKVLLSDVARAARVGKGTLYLYFESKEDLYFAVLLREFSILVERLRRLADDETAPPAEQLTDVVRALVEHLFKKEPRVELLGVVMTCPTTEEWKTVRAQAWGIIEGIIRRGVDQGVFEDRDPGLTAQYVTGLIRAACLFKRDGLDAETMYTHAMHFILSGIAKA